MLLYKDVQYKEKNIFYSDDKLKTCFGGSGVFCFSLEFWLPTDDVLLKFLSSVDQLELQKKNASYFFSLENYLKKIEHNIFDNFNFVNIKITSWNRKWSQCLCHDYTLYVGKIVLKSYQPKIPSLQTTKQHECNKNNNNFNSQSPYIYTQASTIIPVIQESANTA